MGEEEKKENRFRPFHQIIITSLNEMKENIGTEADTERVVADCLELGVYLSLFSEGTRVPPEDIENLAIKLCEVVIAITVTANIKNLNTPNFPLEADLFWEALEALAIQKYEAEMIPKKTKEAGEEEEKSEFVSGITDRSY